MMMLNQGKSDYFVGIRIRKNSSKHAWPATRGILQCVMVAAAGFLLASFSTMAYAQIDNLDAAKDEALSHSEVPRPLTDQPSLPRNKIDGTTFSLTDLKSQTRLVTPGWLRTYATVSLPPDLLLAVPEYYETALESDMRANIQQSLADREIETIEDPEQSSFRLTYAVEVREPEKSSLGQSRLRLESDALDNDNSWSPRLARPGDGVRPGISLGLMPEYEPRGPVLRASIIVLDGDERVWSGFAEAELGDHLRSELTRVLVRALMRHWGQNAAMDGGHFSQSPGAGLSLNEDGAGQP